MTLLFIDYTNLVVKTYEEKREANQLSQLLMHPTTANIRQECLNVYNEKIKKGEQIEENTLRAFFGVPPVGKNFGHVIERYNADRFRPLKSLIKREIKNPALANVELLAWLIDFTPRPLSHAQKTLGNINGTNTCDSPIVDNGEPEPDPVEIIVTEKKEISSGTDIVNSANLSQDTKGEASIIGNENIGKLSTRKLKSYLQNSKLKTITTISLIMAILFGGMYIIRQDKKFGEVFRVGSLIRNSNKIKLTNINNSDSTSYSIRRQSVFCQAITKKGTRCKRKAKSNGYCWQHGG
jgi:hypothetical protein